MPPLHPGDPGPAGGDDDDPGADDELADAVFRTPLPPEDRLWRHPSEMTSGRRAGAPPGRRRTAVVAVGGLAAGALLAVAGLGAGGAFDDRVVERRVATPTASVDDGVPDIVRTASPSVAAVAVRRPDGEASGSAVALRPGGILVTDATLVRGARSVAVVLHGGVRFEADLVGADERTGVAVLRVPAAGLRPIRVGRSDRLTAGSETVLVGARDVGGWRASVQTASVSAMAPRIEGGDGSERYGMIVVDVPFAAGTAGAALVDGDGTLVGIVAGIGDPSAGGLATPIELVLHVADQLVSRGHARHVWLGLHGSDHPGGGAVVDDVVPGGPGATAGVTAGDVIVAVDGETTATMAELITALRLHLPGDVVVLRVRRGDAAFEVRAELGARAG